MAYKNFTFNDQLNEIQAELDFYNKARANFENLQNELKNNEHLRFVYEPSAKLLLEKAEDDLALAIKQAANSVKEEVSSAAAVAQQIKASTMDITLKTPESNVSGFIDIGLLGKTLNNFQSLIYSIIDPVRGRKKKEVKEAGALLVSAFAPGSFVVRVHEQTNGLIADENLILETAVPIIVDLMKSSEDIDQLKEYTSTMDLLTVSAYRNLLKTLSRGESGINIKWASPYGNGRDYSLNFQQVRTAIKLFNSDRNLTNRMITIDGTLIMFERDDEHQRRRFKMSSYDGALYSGAVSEELPGQFVPTEIRALLEERVDKNRTTDEEYKTYTLLKAGAFAQDEDDK